MFNENLVHRNSTLTRGNLFNVASHNQYGLTREASDKMVNHWVFPVNDDVIEGIRKKGTEIYRQRMTDGFWGLAKGVQNRSYLKPNDKVVFYLAGKEGHMFLGTCILDSEYHKLSEEEKHLFWHGPFFRASHGVKIKEVRVWKSPKLICPLLSKLEFIKNKDNWGIYLHRSIVRMSKDDYNTIV